MIAMKLPPVKRRAWEMPICPECDVPVCTQPRGTSNGVVHFECPYCGSWLTIIGLAPKVEETEYEFAY